MKKNPIIKNALILTIITLIAGLGLGFVYEITKNPIAQAQEKAKKESMAGGIYRCRCECFCKHRT